MVELNVQNLKTFRLGLKSVKHKAIYAYCEVELGTNSDFLIQMFIEEIVIISTRNYLLLTTPFRDGGWL